MSSWSSVLFVFSDSQGREYVSTAMPTGLVCERSQLRAFQAAGPYMPIGWPKPQLVGNASHWMECYQARGFSFQPLGLGA
jgi:hypothetical protein